MNFTPRNTLLALACGLAVAMSASIASAQEAAAPNAQAAQAWRFKTKRLSQADVDASLDQPAKVVFLDLRRPDELIKYGSFPVFLNIQNKDLEKQLAYLPKDRGIVTVSNHAQRAGAAGDLLTAKGYTVIGAAGSEDYEKEGGKAVVHIQPPAPRVANAASASTPRP
jgi:rhodanese-related sulfurtransferase